MVPGAAETVMLSVTEVSGVTTVDGKASVGDVYVLVVLWLRFL